MFKIIFYIIFLNLLFFEFLSIKKINAESIFKKRYSDMPALEFADIPYKYPVRYFTTKDNIRLAYIEKGNGQTLLLIHGLGSYLRFWDYQVDFFANKGYRVIALDLPGYGKSDKPSTYSYTMEAFGDSVVEFIQGLNLGNPILFGHSMGGQTSLSIAIRYPNLPKALVLVAPAGFEEFSKREKEWFKNSFVDASIFRRTTEENVWRAIRYDNFSNWRDELEWLVEYRVRFSKNKDFDKYGYANIKSIWGLSENDFVRNNLDKIKIPTFIIYGDEDKLIPNPFLHPGNTRDVMIYGEKNIKGSKRVELKKCGHTVQMDCPDKFNQEVYEYIKQL
ncbi:MAG: alpha/beta hydrolase [Candidatus Omnitrophica bacterium]|nr:alpha/beta hydrolase [Candidatus Omnitrophota bacterium]